MILPFSRISLCINILAALLLVTILNAYIISTKFKTAAENDAAEHITRHIHSSRINARNTLPTLDPKQLNSDPNPLYSPNAGGGGGGGEEQRVLVNHNSADIRNNKTELATIKNEWMKHPMQEEEGSIYPRDICFPRATNDQALLDFPLTVVTATSEGYVGHVHNLIGSIHTHHPSLEVVVYGLELYDSTKALLQEYCGVTVRQFDLSAYPPHVRNLKNFAWKALVVKQALLDYGKILYLDSGYEIRKPLNFIKGRIEREGYFCTGMGDSLTRGGREEMFNFFNTSTLEYLGLPMTAGGVHGATYWGGAFEGIITPASKCSVDENCIEPSRAGDEVRSFGKDQPLFSNLVYRGGCTQCAMSGAFTAHSSLENQAGDPLVPGKQHLFHRRGSGPFNGRGKKIGNDCSLLDRQNYQRWQEMRPKYENAFLDYGGCPHTRFSERHEIDEYYVLGDVPKSVEKVVAAVRRKEITIVTSATQAEVTHLNELLRSIQEWEPDRKIVVYDLGLEDSQTQTISKVKNVRIVKLDLSDPPHLSNLKNMAWRPVIWADAYKTCGNFIYLSPTHVLYQRLDTLIFLLERDGIFTATVGTNLLDLFTSSQSAAMFFKQWPAVSQGRRTNNQKLMEEFEFKPPCTGAVMGLWNGSKAGKLVLPPLYDCSMDATCWKNSVSSVNDQKYTDQLLLSVTIYDKICYTCNRDYDFYAYSGKRKNIIHNSHDINVFNTALIDEVQIIYDTVS